MRTRDEFFIINGIICYGDCLQPCRRRPSSDNLVSPCRATSRLTERPVLIQCNSKYIIVHGLCLGCGIQ